MARRSNSSAICSVGMLVTTATDLVFLCDGILNEAIALFEFAIEDALAQGLGQGLWQALALDLAVGRR
jgi:hypothetical protein